MISNMKKSKVISPEEYAEMARAKLKYLNQSLIISERLELEGCGLHHSHANLNSFNFLTNFLMID